MSEPASNAEKSPPGSSRWSRLGQACRRVLGLRRTIVAAGVRYRERSSLPLHRALSPGGPGSKEYDATFPSGETMRLRVTRGRDYPDITGTTRPSDSNLLEQLARPGMRVALLGCGTGQLGEWLGLCVGPSGGVVGLDRDGESIRYARRRYGSENVAFEIGTLETLAREFADAFDGIVATDADLAPTDDDAAELWRLVRPGGWLLVPRPVAEAIGRAVPPIRRALEAADEGPRMVVIVKPEKERSDRPGANA